MTLIEGVGDEVTLLVAALVLLVVLCLAWVSTSVPDLGRIRFIILDHTDFHRLGEIARRYQIIGYQIISGHVVRNHNIEQDGAEGEGRGDQAEEPSGEDGSEHSGDQSGEEDEELRGLHPDTESEPESEPSPDQSEFPAAPANSQSQPAASLPRESASQSDTSHSESTRQGSNDTEAVPEETVASTDSADTTDAVPGADIADVNELRRRRLTFFDKQTESAPGVDEPLSAPHSSQVPPDSSESSSDADTVVPEEGSSVDGERTEGGAEDAPSGEAATSGETQMRVRIKYFDDRLRQVDARPSETIGEFKRKHFAPELAENMLVRFIHNGRELHHDASTLQACNIRDGAVIHALLTRAHREEQPDPEQGEDLNMGALMVPLFGVLLALIWYCRVNYRQFFNGTSTISLIGISLLYVCFITARLYVDRRDVQH